MARLGVLLTGIGLGVLGYALYERRSRIAEREDPELLLNHLSRQVEELEALMKRSRPHRHSLR